MGINNNIFDDAYDIAIGNNLINEVTDNIQDNTQRWIHLETKLQGAKFILEGQITSLEVKIEFLKVALKEIEEVREELKKCM